MYDSNAVAKQWLLSNRFNYIVLFTHTRYGMPHTWSEDGKIYHKLQKDLYALFDGVCLSKDGFVTFIQVKTGAFPKTAPIQTFLKRTKASKALGINVYHGSVRVRLYSGKRVKTITPDIRKFIKKTK